MFKFVAVFALVIVVANAGIIGHAPAIVAAPIHSHASSYANSQLISVHPQPVAVAAHTHHAALAVPVAHVGIAHEGLLGHGGLLGHHGGFIH